MISRSTCFGVGAEREWAAWCFAFEACWGLLRELATRTDDVMELVDDDPMLHEMLDSSRELSRVVFALLVSLVQGRAITVLMGTVKHNRL